MVSKSIIPVILCGGSGTRLWPLSRDSFPKQFLKLDSEDNKSLLQKTYERLYGLKNISAPILVSNEEHRFIVAEQMREIAITPQKILLEPFRKNTAPAIVLSALIALENEDDPTLLILSSDHQIKDVQGFIEILEIAKNYSNLDRLVTFGVIPTYPETGYGYIKSEKIFDITNIEGLNISRFIEKPSLEIAKSFIRDKSYTWNSGMFMFKAKNLLDEIKRYEPRVLKYCIEALEGSTLDLDFQRLNKEKFKNCPNISIDNAVMEKTNKGTVIPINIGWSDIGSWKSVWENSLKDKNSNVEKGNVILRKTKSSYFRSEERLIVGIGLKDLLVVETRDAILIANKNNDQEVKDIVQELKRKGIPEGSDHKRAFRPWGNFLTIAENKNWRVKIINVKPGERLSLQRHQHRSEHWIIVKGRAEIQIENKKFFLDQNQSTYIPIKAKHRLGNPGNLPLSIIEIQSGTYVGEDDIQRFNDDYGRGN